MDANKIRIIRIIRGNPRFRRYPEYKESGVKWIGEIPSHWRKSRLKYESLVPVQYGLNINSDLYVEQGIRFIRTTDITDDGELIGKGVYLETKSVEEIYLTQPNDFLISRSGTLGRTYLHQSEAKHTYGGYLVRFNFGCAVKSRFIFYFTRSQCFADWIALNTVQSTIGNVNGQKYSNLEIPVPSFSEQAQIANFLDRKTEQIDELIRLKERRIELLQAQRNALINQVVTKGLDPNVEMKPSGVEWIGEIPRHWTLTRLKYVSSIPVTYGLNIEADRYTTEGIRLIRITDIDESGGLRQKGVYLSEDCVPQEQMLNSYDLLLSRSGATVGKSYLHLEKGKYTSAGYLVRFNFDDYWTSKFIYYVTLSHFYRNWLEQQIIISTIQNVNGEKYSNFQLPIPLYQEHKQIVDFLDRKTEQIDELIAAEHRKIELLKEYRQSLISEAVTGKIDVRNEV